jgi:hypothetical protein
MQWEALNQLNREMIREKIMYSNRFAQLMGDSLRDDLTDHQAALISLCIVHADDAHLGRYVREIFTTRVYQIIDKEIALYQPDATDCERPVE